MSDMIDVAIDSDEAYPVYFLRTPNKWCPAIGQVDADTYERWTRITKEYDRVQTEMASFRCVHDLGGHTFTTLEPDRGLRCRGTAILCPYGRVRKRCRGEGGHTS